MTESEPDHSGWTLETLRIYLDTQIGHLDALMTSNRQLHTQRFEDQDKAVAAALAAQEKAVVAALAAAEKAVAKAEAAAEKRFENVNEFRAQLADQAGTFMQRTEALQRIETNAEKIDALAARIDKTEGHSGGLNAGWLIVVSAIGLISTVVVLYLALR